MTRFVYSEADLLGKGTYAAVYAAVDTQGSLGKVALKRIDFDHMVEGCPLLLLREIGIARKLKHPNLVPVLAIQYSPLDGRALIAFELLHCDLRQFLNRNGPLREQVLADATLQLASGIDYMHSFGFLHRDLKPQNVLVADPGTFNGSILVKIGDFGLARPYSPKLAKYTKEVMTLWYRCPELLLGGHIYGPRGDCWGLGCLIGEMTCGVAMFSGESEVSVMFKIFKLLGTPSESVWPGVTQLCNFSPKFPKWTVSHSQRREHLASLFETPLDTPKERLRSALLFECVKERPVSHITRCIIDVLEGLLCFLPANRLSAGQVKAIVEKECAYSSPRLCVRD